ncbi:UvrD-helicase domain-containing protein, partial [Halarchaeum acidiphilum]|uniref:UvrD-helicase domain-containing protein n=1 Tax=Halarchaeum acidiphilum TaxID=489138 RepID=UPI0005D2651D
SGSADRSRRRRALAADRDLYDEWGACIDALADVHAVYRAAYDSESRERGIVAQRDRAHWIAAYFDDPAVAHRAASASVPHETIAERRAYLRERWQSALSTLIIDEAQDVSAGQHRALASLVGEGARVLCYGQLEQTINQWRNAEPALFRAAIADGEYLGREWETHAVETADRTYRQRPALADATNAVAGAALR